VKIEQVPKKNSDNYKQASKYKLTIELHQAIGPLHDPAMSLALLGQSMQKMELHAKIDDNGGGEISCGSFQSCGVWAHSDRCVMLNESCLGCGEGGRKLNKQ
jgi:hypothetical protein